MLKRFSRCILAVLVISTFVLSFMPMNPSVIGQESRTLRILDISSGLDHATFGTTYEMVPEDGYSFTVKIMLDGATSNLFSWDVAVTYDKTSLVCTGVWIPSNDSSYVFNGKDEVSAVDMASQNSTPPQIVAGSTLQDPNQAVTTSNALLFMMN